MPVATKLDRVKIYNEQFSSKSHKALWLRGFTRSREKLDLLYLYNHKAYGHQTWQGGDLLWEASFHKVTWPFDQVVLEGYLTN